MESKNRRVAFAGLILSVLLALLGQFYLAKKPGYWWDGIVIYAAAMMVFSLVAARLESAPYDRDRPASPRLWLAAVLRRNVVRSVLVASGAFFVLYVTLAALHRPYSEPFWDLLVLWLLGVALTAGAFVRWRRVPAALEEAWRSLQRHSVEATFLALITLAAFLLRAINVEHIPFVLSGDEASMGLEAVDVLRGGRTNPFVTGWFSNPMLYFFLQALFIKALGQTVVAIRLSSVLVSSATVVLLYVFARHYYGRWVALLSALFLATYHYSIHYGRMALNNIWDPFLSLGAFYFFSRGLETKRLRHWLSAALFVGFSVYFHAGSRLTEMMMAVYFLYWLLRDRSILRGNVGRLVVFLLVTLLIVLPLFAFFATHPNDMMAPWERRSIFATGWVDEQIQATGKSVAAILTQQFLKSVLAFNAVPDRVFHYYPGIPLLHFVPSIFFVFGLAYAVRNIKQPKYFLLVLWFFSVIVFGSWLLENPPSSHRLLLAIPPVVLCVALGVTRLVSYAAELLGQSRRASHVLSLVLVLLFAFQSVSFYFNTYTPSHVFGGGNTEVADRMGKYLRVLGPQYQCYFFGAPRMYYGFASIRYLAPEMQGLDLEQPITGDLSFVNPNHDAVFVFLPERAADFDAVRSVYPVGLKREFKDVKGQILFISYEVDL